MIKKGYRSKAWCGLRENAGLQTPRCDICFTWTPAKSRIAVMKSGANPIPTGSCNSMSTVTSHPIHFLCRPHFHARIVALRCLWPTRALRYSHPEAVLRQTRDVFQVSAAAGASGLSPLRLFAPVVCSAVSNYLYSRTRLEWKFGKGSKTYICGY